MSDPVTNVEIEDVLASIRRLVSQGDRPADSRPETTEAARAPAPATDRLVLTPALRVSDPAPSDETAEEDEEDVAEFEADAPEAEEPAIETTFHSTRGSGPLAPAPGTEIQWDATDTGASRASLLATIAELEAAVGGSDGWEPDGSETEPQVDWTGLASPPRAREPEPKAAPEAEESPQPEAPADTPEPTATATNRTVIDLAGLAERAPRPESAATKEEAAYDDTPAPGTEGADDLGDDLDEDLSSYMTGETAIDEEGLRDLVAEIVREELQGALGERITRNVRKLVRREIYRILSSQDFD